MKCWWLRVFWSAVAFSVFLAGGAAAAPVSCSDIEDGKTQWKDCIPTKNLGHVTKFVRLDFSNANQKEIDEFFGKAGPQSALVAAIKIVGNENLQTLNFGKIETWKATDLIKDGQGLFIEIANNPNLKSILWNVTTVNPQDTSQVLVYNNPQLILTNTTVDLIMNYADKTHSHVEQQLGVCWFQHPKLPAKYDKPSPTLLDRCDTIKGDLILQKMTLSQNLTLADTNVCVRLVDMTMTGVTVKVPNSKTGSLSCGNTQTSEITGNTGLCGADLQALEDYFPTPPKTEMVRTGCGTICDKTAAPNKYTVCKEISEDVDISTWFDAKHPDLNLKPNELEKAAKAKLTIAGIAIPKLNMPKLTEVKGLEIRDVQLKDFDLPALKSLETLVLVNNPDLPLSKMKDFPKPSNMAGSTIECYTKGTAIKRMDELSHCTVIKGALILDGSQLTALQQHHLDALHVTEVDGCVTVKDMKLTNLDFLKNTQITCTDPKGHLLKDNPKLCVPDYLKKSAKVDTPGTDRTVGCGVSCYDLAKDNCVNFEGDLVFNSSIPASRLKSLEAINGSLSIVGTNLTSLEFPKLVMITTVKSPGLQVANNSKLESLKMPKLTDITAADGGILVKIVGNPRLSSDKLKEFVPSKILATCGDGATGDCHFDCAGCPAPPVPWYVEYRNWLIGAGVAVVLIYCALCIYCKCSYNMRCVQAICWCCYYRKSKREKQQKQRKDRAEAYEACQETIKRTIEKNEREEMAKEKEREREEMAKELERTQEDSLPMERTQESEDSLGLKRQREKYSTNSCLQRESFFNSEYYQQIKKLTVTFTWKGFTVFADITDDFFKSDAIVRRNTMPGRSMKSSKGSQPRAYAFFEPPDDNYLKKEMLTAFNAKYGRDENDDKIAVFPFVRNVHLVSLYPTIDLHRDRIFNVLYRQWSDAYGNNKKNIPTIRIIHFGKGFKNCFKKANSSPPPVNTIYIYDESTSKDGIIQTFKMDFTTPKLAEDGEHRTVEIELVECAFSVIESYNFQELSRIRWYEWLEMAYREDIIIHTDIPECFILLFFIYSTMEHFVAPDNDTVLYSFFWKQMYFQIKELYNPEAMPAMALLLWFAITMKLFFKKMNDDKWYQEVVQNISKDAREKLEKKKLEIKKVRESLQELIGQQTRWGKDTKWGKPLEMPIKREEYIELITAEPERPAKDQKKKSDKAAQNTGASKTKAEAMPKSKTDIPSKDQVNADNPPPKKTADEGKMPKNGTDKQQEKNKPKTK